MTKESDQTVEHKASDLAPVEGGTQDRNSEDTTFSVTIEGQVYAVKAKNAKEAGDKAKKLHKAGKDQA